MTYKKEKKDRNSLKQAYQIYGFQPQVLKVNNKKLTYAIFSFHVFKIQPEKLIYHLKSIEILRQQIFLLSMIGFQQQNSLSIRGCSQIMSAAKGGGGLENADIGWLRGRKGQTNADIGWQGLANAEMTNKMSKNALKYTLTTHK